MKKISFIIIWILFVSAEESELNKELFIKSCFQLNVVNVELVSRGIVDHDEQFIKVIELSLYDTTYFKQIYIESQYLSYPSTKKYCDYLQVTDINGVEYNLHRDDEQELCTLFDEILNAL